MKILIMNAGSSSHKLCVYELQNQKPIEPLWKGSIDWQKDPQHRPYLTVAVDNDIMSEQILTDMSIKQALERLLTTLWSGEHKIIQNATAIERVGHRVVHGGSRFTSPIIIDTDIKNAIHALIPLAPLHNPANLHGIELMEYFFPDIPHIAVFDTAFHATMPEMVKTYPVPWSWKEKGVQRYGFHGISHHYCAERLALLMKKELHELKIINCHLGNGCSLCAIQNGHSYETTMGLTPLEGLMMGTRCGSIDPGILLYLMRTYGFTAQDLDNQLNFASGLKGICEYADMRTVLSKQQEPQATLALEMFVHRLKTSIGALAVSLNGFDILSFTGGIGENAPSVRATVCSGLSCFNMYINVEKNNICKPDAEITNTNSSIRTFIIHTEEEWMIARACFMLNSDFK